MDLASDIGVSKKDLNQSIRLLLDYLDDKRDDIKGHITWYGVSQETFNEKRNESYGGCKGVVSECFKVC